MEYSTLLVSKEENVMIITLNRPKVYNCLNSQLLEEFEDVIDKAKYDDETFVLVITGMGEKAFCAGADLNELVNLDFFKAKKIFEKGQSIFRKLELLGKPTIAAVNGYAFGGGFELTLACSIRIASENAIFALPEVKLGMIPGYGGTQRLPRLIGKGPALDLLLTGRRLSAEEALSLNLLSQVVPQEELISTAINLAEKILENSKIAITQVLQAVERGLDLPMDSALALETLLDSIAASSDEQREGVAAFLEKRKPNFKNM